MTSALRDFTLVIPTYNRHEQVKALLAYLHNVPIPILVLDSSDNPVDVESLPKRAGGVARFPPDMHPWDKYCAGVEQVETEFVSICAADDVRLPDGIGPCLEALRDNRRAVLARGHHYSFLWQDETLLLTGTRLVPPAIKEDTPISRLAKLYADYHPSIYTIQRTEVLKKTLQAVKPMRSLFGCEMLSSALTAVAGDWLTIDKPTHVRSIG